ncbi:GH18515 [Drosophila grimshawi]|uniref:GH18515 n=1 Tax=Drosophila grimshawi TaxID=7222 RepID=B4JIC8_DROGR|nr:GH18515 [Drosophila grimshawi]
MSNVPISVTSLIIKAQKLSGDFNELLQKTSCLLAESQNVEQKLIECRGAHDNQLLKNLVRHCNDEERVNQLLENAELQQVVEEYKAGVDHIMDKYKFHCNGNILYDTHNLKDKYVAKLQEVANSLEKRIEEMTLVMIFFMSLDEENSKENQRTIQQLIQENKEMRRKLQISSASGEKDYFQQALPPCTESGTQSDLDDTIIENSDSSVDSFGSVVTSFSSALEFQSTDNSTLSGSDSEEKIH